MLVGLTSNHLIGLTSEHLIGLTSEYWPPNRMRIDPHANFGIRFLDTNYVITD